MRERKTPHSLLPPSQGERVRVPEQHEPATLDEAKRVDAFEVAKVRAVAGLAQTRLKALRENPVNVTLSQLEALLDIAIGHSTAMFRGAQTADELVAIGRAVLSFAEPGRRA